uniref:Uncharacterized protein n=1 Tax=Anguilla anguilla TaxID=7936 RepID=A0A0E9UBB1_ANGAN
MSIKKITSFKKITVMLWKSICGAIPLLL